MNDKDALIELFNDSLTQMMDTGEFDDCVEIEDFEDILGFAFTLELLENKTIEETYTKFFNDHIKKEVEET